MHKEKQKKARNNIKKEIKEKNERDKKIEDKIAQRVTNKTYTIWNRLRCFAKKRFYQVH